jgi:hypothetical protein
VSRLDSKSIRPTGILIRRPKTTVYTVLLGMAAAAIAIGCLLLYLEMAQYGGMFWFLKAAWKPSI